MAGPPELLGSTLYRSFARVDVGNAIAAIEGEVALTYLLKHGTFSIIDTNNNGLITSQEIQNFVDNAAGMGLPEAGAMARLLGGTGRAAVDTTFTDVAEQPDQPDVLQRRYNFFDYASDGRLNGAISIKQYKLLQKNLLPTADQYTITDRQRASANGFLIAPASQRNFRNLQKLSPKYEFVSIQSIRKYRGVSPAQFGVNRGLKGANVGPLFTLFNGKAGVQVNPTITTTPATTPATTGTATGTGSTSTTSTTTDTKPVVTTTPVTHDHHPGRLDPACPGDDPDRPAGRPQGAGQAQGRVHRLRPRLVVLNWPAGEVSPDLAGRLESIPNPAGPSPPSDGPAALH